MSFLVMKKRKETRFGKLITLALDHCCGCFGSNCRALLEDLSSRGLVKLAFAFDGLSNGQHRYFVGFGI